MRYGLLGLAVLYALVGAASASGAQEDASARSQKLFAAALEAKRAGELPRALCLMQRAQSAWSNAAFSFNIAQLQRELGMCEEARENYQAFLSDERDLARRKAAEKALAELAKCTPRMAPPPAADSCNAWEVAALRDSQHQTPSAPAPGGERPRPSHAAARGGARPNADSVAAGGGTGSGLLQREPGEAGAAGSEGGALAPTPSAVARAQVTSESSPLVAATSAARSKRSVRDYLPWIFAGVGVACVAASGYELAQMSSAQRELDARPTKDREPELRAEGRSAETLLWVFASGAALSIGAALVLALTNSDDPPPSAAAR